MSDELDVLRHDNDVIEPDPQFRAELMDQLRHVMASGSEVAPNALTLSRVASDRTEKDPPHQRRPSRWLAVLAVAACLLAVVAVAAVVMPGHEALDTIDPADAPTTSPASTTIAQYGRVVREHSAAIRAWIDREESSDHVEDSFPQYVRERYLELRPLLASFHSALAELPPPPDEIAALVDGTKQQVSDALNSVDLLLSCGAASPYTRCGDERSEADVAYKALPSLFAAWRPYT
jgi:hypothetical protein